jgi:hypothetical protein
MHHSIHHYKDQTVTFVGMSSPLWNIVLDIMSKFQRRVIQSKDRRST